MLLATRPVLTRRRFSFSTVIAFVDSSIVPTSIKESLVALLMALHELSDRCFGRGRYSTVAGISNCAPERPNRSQRARPSWPLLIRYAARSPRVRRTNALRKRHRESARTRRVQIFPGDVSPLQHFVTPRAWRGVAVWQIHINRRHH